MKYSKKFLSKKMVYRNLAYTVLFAFSLYICYKTYKTQRRIREGNPKDAGAAFQEAIKAAIEECIAECPVEKKECPKSSECDRDDKDCKKEATDCGKETKECKQECSVSGKGDKKKKKK